MHSEQNIAGVLWMSDPFNLFQRIAKKMLLAQIKANYSSGDDSSSEDEDCKKDEEEKSSTKTKDEGSSEAEGRGPVGKELKMLLLYCLV